MKNGKRDYNSYTMSLEIKLFHSRFCYSLNYTRSVMLTNIPNINKPRGWGREENAEHLIDRNTSHILTWWNSGNKRFLTPLRHVYELCA